MAKGKSKGRNNSGGGGVADAAQTIDFTGKESKQELIQKMVDAGAYYQFWSNDKDKVEGRVQSLQKEKKPELQQMVKRVNVDLENGGKGNASVYYTNANITRYKTDAQIQKTPTYKRVTEKFSKERDGGGASSKKAQDEINNLVNTKYYGSISKSERASYKKDVLAILAKYD